MCEVKIPRPREWIGGGEEGGIGGSGALRPSASMSGSETEAVRIEEHEREVEEEEETARETVRGGRVEDLGVADIGGM